MAVRIVTVGHLLDASRAREGTAPLWTRAQGVADRSSLPGDTVNLTLLRGFAGLPA